MRFQKFVEGARMSRVRQTQLPVRPILSRKSVVFSLRGENVPFHARDIHSTDKSADIYEFSFQSERGLSDQQPTNFAGFLGHSKVTDECVCLQLKSVRVKNVVSLAAVWLPPHSPRP